jgi:hypothetical protein
VTDVARHWIDAFEVFDAEKDAVAVVHAVPPLSSQIPPKEGDTDVREPS